MVAKSEFEPSNSPDESEVVVEFDPQWAYCFGYPTTKIQDIESEVDQIFSSGTIKEIGQKLNRIANNLEFFERSNAPERYLRGHFSIGRKVGRCSSGIRLAVSRSEISDIKKYLCMLELRLQDEVIGRLFVIRELWRPLFIEFFQIISSEEALREMDKNRVVAPANLGTDRKSSKALTAGKYQKERRDNMSKFKAGRVGRPKDEPYRLFWKLLSAVYPRLLKLPGIDSETRAILVFGVLADGCNSYHLIRELQRKIKNSKQSKRNSLAYALYDRLRQPFYKFRKSNWKNPNRNVIANGKGRMEIIKFHPLLDFFRKLTLMPDARICDMKLSRYVCKLMGIKRYSKEKLSSQDLFQFLTRELKTRSYFQSLGFWPGILEELFQNKKHILGKKI